MTTDSSVPDAHQITANARLQRSRRRWRIFAALVAMTCGLGAGWPVCRGARRQRQRDRPGRRPGGRVLARRARSSLAVSGLTRAGAPGTMPSVGSFDARPPLKGRLPWTTWCFAGAATRSPTTVATSTAATSCGRCGCPHDRYGALEAAVESARTTPVFGSYLPRAGARLASRDKARGKAYPQPPVILAGRSAILHPGP